MLASTVTPPYPLVIDAVNFRQYIGAVIRISASIHLPLIGDAERMGLKLQKHSYCILNRQCAMSCATTIIEENIMFTHLKEYEKMLREGCLHNTDCSAKPSKNGATW